MTVSTARASAPRVQTLCCLRACSSSAACWSACWRAASSAACHGGALPLISPCGHCSRASMFSWGPSGLLAVNTACCGLIPIVPDPAGSTPERTAGSVRFTVPGNCTVNLPCSMRPVRSVGKGFHHNWSPPE